MLELTKQQRELRAVLVKNGFREAAHNVHMLREPGKLLEQWKAWESNGRWFRGVAVQAKVRVVAPY